MVSNRQDLMSYRRSIEEDADHKGDKEKEWRTFRCLHRKHLSVPRLDDYRFKRIGITSVRTLLRIHYTMIPDLWERLQTSKGPHVKMVAWFCFWAQECEYSLNKGSGPRPGPIADDVVERFAEWQRHQGSPSEAFPWKVQREKEESRRKYALVKAVENPNKNGIPTWTQEEVDAARIKAEQQALFEDSMLGPQPEDKFDEDVGLF